MKTLVFALALVLAPLSAAAQAVPEWAAPVPQDEFQSHPTRRAGPTGSPGLPAGNGSNPNAPGAAAGTRVPIDGGLGWLALAGGAYAVRRLRNRDENLGGEG